jgi:hypothetical protein
MLCLLPGNADSAVVVIDTTGYDNSLAAGFYGINFLSGQSNEYIISVQFLLNADNAFFDFDGSGSYSNQFAPVFGPLNGVAREDIDWGGGNIVGGVSRHNAFLSIDFAPRSFTPGDSVRFAADTDNMPGGTSGSAFAGNVCIVLVYLNIGNTITNLSYVNSLKAEGSAVITNQIVLRARPVGDQLELTWPWFPQGAQLEEAVSLGRSSVDCIVRHSIPHQQSDARDRASPCGPTLLPHSRALIAGEPSINSALILSRAVRA